MRKLRNSFATTLRLLLLTALIPACAYRFTNRHISTPAGASTIAIESIFDTSREVFPHEVLWDSLQRTFAKNGHLRLAPRHEADLILRVHIAEGNITPAGSAEKIGPENDPKLDTAVRPEYNLFRILPRAGTFSQIEAVTARMEVEVFDLRSKELVMSKTYSVASSFKSIRDKHLFAANSNYLFYEESITSAFKRMSDDIANRVLTDLLVQ